MIGIHIYIQKGKEKKVEYKIKIEIKNLETKQLIGMHPVGCFITRGMRPRFLSHVASAEF